MVVIRRATAEGAGPAASQTIGNYWLPRYLHQFQQTYPGISLHLAIGNTHEVEALVGNGEVDVGFVEGIVSGDAMLVRPVDEDRLLIVAAPSVTLPTLLDTAWLTAAPWVAREAGSGTREAFESALRTFGVRVAERKIVLELPSNEAVRAAVEAGAGLGIMSELVVEASIRSGTLVPLPLALPNRRFYGVWHRQRYLSLAARSLLAICGTEC